MRIHNQSTELLDRTSLHQSLGPILQRLLNSGQSEAILVAEFLADLLTSDETVDLDLLRTSAQEIIDSAQAVLDATTPPVPPVLHILNH